MIQTKISAVNLDDVIDAQSAISNAFMRIAHAESVIDCLLTMGNIVKAEDFNVQLGELADILQSAQSELMRSETWFSCEHDCQHALSATNRHLENMKTMEYFDELDVNDYPSNNKQRDFDEFMDYEEYDAIKKIVKRELKKQKKKPKAN